MSGTLSSSMDEIMKMWGGIFSIQSHYIWSYEQSQFRDEREKNWIAHNFPMDLNRKFPPFVDLNFPEAEKIPAIISDLEVTIPQVPFNHIHSTTGQYCTILTGLTGQ